MDRSDPARKRRARSCVSLTFDGELPPDEIERIRRSLGARAALHVPPAVGAAYERARQVGFTKASRPEVGALIAVLAAAVPTGGRILELGTGTGVGVAWAVHGLRGRSDVDVVSVEIDRDMSELVSRADWPHWVSFVVGDAREVIPAVGAVDLTFLDIPGGLKASVLDDAVTALRPGGHLLIDDMKARWGRGALDGGPERLLEDPRVVCAQLTYSSGMILAARLSD